MSRRTLAYIIAAVVAVHLGVFVLLAHIRALPKAPHTIPPPNFGYREVLREDTVSGEKTITREFNVSTKLAPKPLPTPSPDAHGNTAYPLPQ